MKIKAIQNKVIVLPHDIETTTEGGIILSASEVKTEHLRGTVVSVGEEVKDYTVGDIVVYSDSVQRLSVDGEEKEYHIMLDTSIYFKEI